MIRRLTLRLSRDEYARAERLAKARRLTLNGLIRELLQKELARPASECELRAAYELLGRDGRDVELAFDAQAEVARSRST